MDLESTAAKCEQMCATHRRASPRRPARTPRPLATAAARALHSPYLRPTCYFRCRTTSHVPPLVRHTQHATNSEGRKKSPRFDSGHTLPLLCGPASGDGESSAGPRASHADGRCPHEQRDLARRSGRHCRTQPGAPTSIDQREAWRLGGVQGVLVEKIKRRFITSIARC